MIPFHLINIPTNQWVSSQRLSLGIVENWDKTVQGNRIFGYSSYLCVFSCLVF